MNKIALEEIKLSLSLDEPDDFLAIKKKAAEKLKISIDELPLLEIKKKSIDARNHNIHLNITLGPKDEQLQTSLKEKLPESCSKSKIIIVGAGPAGLFCAYQLARMGISSIICERGKKVQERRKDLKGLNQHGVVDEDSNYCFGEGGAGTYSDGKLYTRSHKRGSIKDILTILVAHGAPKEILTDARPHIGSNRLPKVITALREHLERAGVRFLFEARVLDLIIEKGVACGVILSDGREVLGRSVVLATGHSATDVIEILKKARVNLLPKPFAMGVRIEHPQALINKIQYGRFFGHPKLSPAYYSLAHTPSENQGVFSFCMCPGGWIVPASTNKIGLVVNGMSLSKRNSPFANSGLVATIPKANDFSEGLKIQAALEASALKASSKGLCAPAIRALDFVLGKVSKSLPATSYLPGIFPSDMEQILNSTKIPLAARIKEALLVFNKKMPGYLSEEAVLVGVESRTSSPVRIERDKDSFESTTIKNLYPIGEGAGYAGGIMSAAMDGINAALKIYENKF